MKVYIVKYALAQGILEREAEDCTFSPNMIRTDDGAYYHGEGKDWTRTKEAAVARAEEIRLKKIDSLQKQIKKLEKLNF